MRWKWISWARAWKSIGSRQESAQLLIDELATPFDGEIARARALGEWERQRANGKTLSAARDPRPHERSSPPSERRGATGENRCALHVSLHWEPCDSSSIKAHSSIIINCQLSILFQLRVPTSELHCKSFDGPLLVRKWLRAAGARASRRKWRRRGVWAAGALLPASEPLLRACLVAALLRERRPQRRAADTGVGERIRSERRVPLPRVAHAGELDLRIRSSRRSRAPVRPAV